MHEVAAVVEEVPQATPPPIVQAVVEKEADDLDVYPEVDQEVDPGVAAIPSKPDKKPPRDSSPRDSKVIQQMHEKEDKNLVGWLEELNPGGAIRVKVQRQQPKVWKGLNVGGVLATYTQQIDEDFIRDHHGGGDFYLIVQKPKASGAGWQWAGGRMISIAGDPRTDDVYRDKGDDAAPNAAAPTNGIVDRVMSSMERQLEREQERQERDRRQLERQQQERPHLPSGAPDSEYLRLLMAPMQKQLDQMGVMLRDKDHQLNEARQAPPPQRDEFRDKMLDKMLDGENARITSLRSQYESELRQVKQSSMDNESRLRDSFDRDKLALGMSHDRELSTLRSSYDMRFSAQESSNATSRALMDGEIRRLQADLAECKHELATLRLKKDKTILEQATEFSAIKEAISDITGGGDEKEKSTLEKGLEILGNMPAVQAGLQKFASGESAPAVDANGNRAQHTQHVQHVQQQAPKPRLLEGPDGNLYKQLPDGNVQLVRRRATAAPPVVAVEAAAPNIAPGTIKIAVDYLEAAFRSGQESDQVAASVRTMIPSEVLGVIRARGVDAFLADVAKIETTSPLATQAGRNWVRKVGKALLG